MSGTIGTSFASRRAWTPRCSRRSPPVSSSAAPTTATPRLSQAYFTRLPLTDAERILALGCGTGIEVRALKRLTQPTTTIIGIDHSAALIDTARHVTADEGVADNVSYDVGDAHHTPYDDDEFDIVTLHTVISHVDDPQQVLREARRIVRPGGVVAVFDGDYASLTFAYPDHSMATTIEERLIQLIVANPRIMRDMPRLVVEAGLELVDAEGSLYANIGTGGFWLAAAESYGPLLARSGLLAPSWLTHRESSRSDPPATTPSSAHPTTTPT